MNEKVKQKKPFVYSAKDQPTSQQADQFYSYLVDRVLSGNTVQLGVNGWGVA